MNGVPDDRGILKIPINFVLCSSISIEVQYYIVMLVALGIVSNSSKRRLQAIFCLVCQTVSILDIHSNTHMLRPSLDHQDESADLRATNSMYFFLLMLVDQNFF